MEWITNCEYNYSVNIDSECVCYKKDILITSSLLPKCSERKMWEFAPVIAKKKKKKGLGWLFIWTGILRSFLQVITGFPH